VGPINLNKGQFRECFEIHIATTRPISYAGPVSKEVASPVTAARRSDRRPGQTIRKVLALDAATGTRKWEYRAPSGTDTENWNSGLLSTEGGLVFGASGGVFFALDADTGRDVWRRSLGGKTKSAPISFTVDGRQVVVVAAGRALFEFGL